MSDVIEFLVKRRPRLVRVALTKEFTPGFFCEACQMWSPYQQHRCLAGLRKPR